MADITGTSKGETLSATPRNDVVKGLGGDDILYGGLSSYIEENNGDGDDVLYGGAGNDQLFDAGGEDRLYGGDGDDLIAVYNHAAIDSGKRGGDKIYGGAGDDDIRVSYSIGPKLKEQSTSMEAAASIGPCSTFPALRAVRHSQSPPPRPSPSDP